MIEVKQVRLATWLVAVFGVLALAGLASCGSSGARAPATPVVETRLPPSFAEPEPAPERPSATAQPSSSEVPVTGNDITWGPADAPVTIVEFLDIQCPFCARVLPTLAELERTYAGRLRFVVKQAPLPFHQHARAAAEMTQAVLALAGANSAFGFMKALMAEQAALGPELYARTARRFGLSPERVAEVAASPRIRAQVDEQLALAQRVGATGTPGFRINAVEVSGAQPLDEFTRVIDGELAEADKLVRAGTPKERIYAARVAVNFSAPPPPRPLEPEPRDDRTYFVPTAKSLPKGPPNAPVTIVEFTDLECPFCRRAQETVRQVLERYPDQVRLVLKHNPLPFHKSAEPAAKLVIEARAQKGDAVAWDVVTRVFALEPPLSEAKLLEIARQLKLNERRVKAAFAKKSQAEIAADQELATDLKAHGTPNFFINGQRLTGAQPLESFTRVVDAELARAERLMKEKSIASARVYGVLMETATRPDPPERKEIPAPSASQPSKGAAAAPVVIQIFSDFQCPFCSRALPTLSALEKRYAGKVRFVWRDMPLAFHRNARPAAIAAREAFAQAGAAGFWKMHDLLFANQSVEGGLEGPALESYAAKLKLDVARFRQAMTDGRHDAAIDADANLAQRTGITGTPSFVINGYFVSGAQPEPMFARAIERALSDTRQPKKAPPRAQSVTNQLAR